MQKILFFDNHDLETMDGFSRRLGQPEKDEGNPLLVPNQPWENGNMQLYGSVAKVEGKPFQLWYSCIEKPWNMNLAYAESEDGLHWRKPELGLVQHEGLNTNIILTDQPHGAAVIHDPQEPDPHAQYKMLCGADSSASCITAYESPDGIHWNRRGKHPVILTEPDCPMGLLRRPEGKYVAFHRVSGYGRRVFRSESWDFIHWDAEPRLVLEPGPQDGAQAQFYGFGAAMYGSYEIGSLWIFHTDPDDLAPDIKMCGYQETEFTYARSGYATHRLSPGRAFIPHGSQGDWDCGNLQCASQPVYLPSEIRYYYAGTDMDHKRRWELDPQKAGLGLARLRPDGFVALAASEQEAQLMTIAFKMMPGQLLVNAAIQPDGWLKAELLDSQAVPIPGFELAACRPVSGDSLAHPLEWSPAPAEWPTGQVRIRLVARNASIFSIYNTERGETPCYWRFREVRPWW